MFSDHDNLVIKFHTPIFIPADSWHSNDSTSMNVSRSNRTEIFFFIFFRRARERESIKMKRVNDSDERIYVHAAVAMCLRS